MSEGGPAAGAPPRVALPAVVEVAVPVPLHQTFDYRLPEALRPLALVGARVLVPFGNRAATGFIVGLRDAPSLDAPALKDVLELLDDTPAIGEELLALCRFVSDYYLAPLGEVLRAAVPAGIERGIDKRVTLTDEGRLRVGLMKGADAKLLDALVLGPQRWRDVVRFGAARLEDLARAGLLEIAGENLAPRVKGKKEPWARLVRAPTDEEAATLKRAPKQRALLEALRGGEARCVSSLREAHGEVADALARLVERGLVVVEQRDVLRDPFSAPPIPHPPPPLTVEQARALTPVLLAIDGARFAPFLLHGVTGSGKTEVYLRAIEHALAAGRTALVLVPEISLTPQLAERFRGRFGDDVAVLHSGLTDSERYDQWRRLRGELGSPVRIAVGARSAIFAPLRNVGVIVVDEEHDSSFKQDETPRYHGRDLALVRGQRAGAVVLLGSATPSLESLHNVRRGKLTELVLSERVHARPMPTMQVVDLSTAELVGSRSAMLSRELADALTETVAAGEQAILFLNRRGYSSFVQCRDCGKTYECRHCSVSLTHHQRAGRLLCHYCGYSESVPQRCATCGGDRVGLLGVGTERIEDALRGLLPEARLSRLDRDTVTSRGRLEAILGAFARREVDVLIGTQMVAKGHDFPGVTLVGVMYADQGLHFPDFRASERTFQLLCQVSGRAGRGNRPGRVLVQTYSAGHLALEAALCGEYERFYEYELGLREELAYPPSGRLVAIRCEGANAALTRSTADAIGRRARDFAETPAYAGQLSVLGPAEAPLARLHGKVRYQMLLRSRRSDVVRRFARELLPSAGATHHERGVRVIVDVDPMNLL